MSFVHVQDRRPRCRTFGTGCNFYPHFICDSVTCIILLYGVLAQSGFAQSRDFDFRFRHYIFALACWNSSVLVTWIICCYHEIDTAPLLSRD